MNKIEVKTKFSNNGEIYQEVQSLGDELRDTVLLREVTKTKDYQVRQALIALGWTPPEKDKS